MATLHLHATADAVEHEWRQALASGGIVELGLGRATPRELVEAAAGLVAGDKLRLGPIGERLVVDAVAEAAGGALGPIAQSRGLRRSLGRIFGALGRVGVGPGELARAALDAGGMAGAHAREIAARLAAYQKHLTSGGVTDEAALWRAGCRAIADGAALPMLADVEVVETHGIVEWDGAMLQLLDALLARGLAVRVIVPAAATGDRALPPSAARALEPLHAALEARHGADRLERVETPLGRARAIDYTRAPTPSAEARHVAERVRDLVDAGVAPETIAVAAATPERRARLEAALARYGVPVAPRRPPSAADAPPVRIALELLALADDDIPRERFIQLITSRYVAGEARGANGVVLPHEIAAALRAAYVTDASGRGYADGLATWARGQFRNVLVGGKAQTICRHVDALVELHPLAAGGGDGRAALRAAARGRRQARAVPARARLSQGRSTAPSDTSLVETRAVARDQAAMRELEVALADLPRAAARAGLRSMKLSRGRFARLLGELLASSRARARRRARRCRRAQRRRRAGRPALCAPVRLRARRRRAAGTAARGSAARRRRSRRRSIARSAPAVLPLAARAVDQAALAFYVALGAADAAHLSWTRGDEDGAPGLRSPLVDELGPADAEMRQLPRDPIPRVAHARTVDELTARVVLEVRGDRASRLSAHDAEAAVLLPAVARHDPPRLGRLEHLIAVERQRHRFFVGDVGAHAYVGALRDPALLAALVAQKLPGRREEPLSATSVEQYAACPFKFFLRAVLRVGELEEVDDEIDHRTLGRLYHDVLEQLFSRLGIEQRFPLVVDEALRRARRRGVRRRHRRVAAHRAARPSGAVRRRGAALARARGGAATRRGGARAGRGLHADALRARVRAAVVRRGVAARQDRSHRRRARARRRARLQDGIEEAAGRAGQGRRAVRHQLAAADLRRGGARGAGADDGGRDVLLAQGRGADQGGAGAARFRGRARRAARADARRRLRRPTRRGGVRALRDGGGVPRAPAQARGGRAVSVERTPSSSPTLAPMSPLERIARFPRDLVVRAGAGTGKTHALVTLYLHLVGGVTASRRRVPPPRIAVVTFTEKAAGELKQRIRERLGAVVAAETTIERVEPTLTAAAKELGVALPDASVWAEALASLGAAPIGTFHSFAGNLLRRHAARAGLDPEYTLLDEAEVIARATQAAERAILDALGAGDGDVEELVAQYNFRAVGRARGLVELLVELRARRAEEGRGAEELDGNYEPAAVARDLDVAVARFGELARRLSGIVPELSAKSTSAALARELCGKLPSLDFRRGDDVAAVMRVVRKLRGAALTTWKEAIDEAHQPLLDAQTSLRAAPLAAALARLCGAVEASYRAHKRRAGVARLHGPLDDGARSVARRRGGTRFGARALRRRAGRRVSGHQPGAGRDGAARRRPPARRRRGAPVRRRRSQAVDLRVPRRRRRACSRAPPASWSSAAAPRSC